MSELAKAMDEDPNTDLARLRKDGVSTPLVFGVIHPLIGSDILCSPRGFGPSWIIKTCIDFSTYLFDKKRGLQLLGHTDTVLNGSYIRFILALFKKKFSTKIKKKPEEILRQTNDYTDIIEELQKETWVHTLESKTLIPSQDCLKLREKNLSFQLQV